MPKVIICKCGRSREAGIHVLGALNGHAFEPGQEIDVPEQVNHPNHYGGDTTYETIKVLAAWGLGFLLGNTVKYISRAGKKDPAKLLEDLKKARWYLDKAIERIERGEALF